jgi:hypothetical protein
VPIGQGQEAFQGHQLRGIKVDSYIFLKKTIGIKTSECKFGKAEFSNG